MDTNDSEVNSDVSEREMFVCNGHIHVHICGYLFYFTHVVVLMLMLVPSGCGGMQFDPEDCLDINTLARRVVVRAAHRVYITSMGPPHAIHF